MLARLDGDPCLTHSGRRPRGGAWRNEQGEAKGRIDAAIHVGRLSRALKRVLIYWAVLET